MKTLVDGHLLTRTADPAATKLVSFFVKIMCMRVKKHVCTNDYGKIFLILFQFLINKVASIILIMDTTQILKVKGFVNTNPS